MAAKAHKFGNLSEAIGTCSRVASMISKPSRALVGFSGGKDSLATLEVCTRVFDQVEAFFMYLVDGLECIESPLAIATRRYGVKVHRVPHWGLARRMKGAIFMPHIVGLHKLRDWRLVDVEKAIRFRTGIDWIAYGWRADDNLQRRVMLKRWGSVWEHSQKFFPLANWSTDNVLGFLRAQKLPTPGRFGVDDQAGTSGFNFTPKCLRFVRERFPADYEKVRKVFPFVDVVLARDDAMRTVQGEV